MFPSWFPMPKDGNVFSIRKQRQGTSAIPVRYPYACLREVKRVAGPSFTMRKYGGRNNGFKIFFNDPN